MLPARKKRAPKGRQYGCSRRADRKFEVEGANDASDIFFEHVELPELCRTDDGRCGGKLQGLELMVGLLERPLPHSSTSPGPRDYKLKTPVLSLPAFTKSTFHTRGLKAAFGKMSKFQ